MLPSGLFNTRYELDMAILRTKTQWLLLALGLALLFTIPLFASPYWLSWLTRLAITVVAVLGLHVLTGLCGLFSIGHAAFIGVGAYTAAILTTRYGLSGWACLPLSMIATGLVGVFFGLPSFRLKGFYLAMATLAAHFVIIWCIVYFRSWTGGFFGLGVPPLKLGGISFMSYEASYILAMVLMVLVTFFVVNIQRMPTGRAFVAIRDNDLAAAVSGINVFRYKMLAFLICCLFAGLAGWMWTQCQMRVNPEQFRLYDAIWYIGMLIVGGMGSTTGVFFGVTFVKLLEVLIDHAAPAIGNAVPFLASQIHVSMGLMLFSAVIIAFLIFEPRGLYSLWDKVKLHYRLHPYSY